MEIELKYKIKDIETSNAIWKDELLKEKEEKGTRQVDDFCGRYYDTENLDLVEKQIAFRTRKEGNKYVATLKWNGNTKGPLHIREELNVRIDEKGFSSPEIEVFQGSEEGKEVLSIIGQTPLIPIMEVNVLRKSFRVDTGEGLFEISVDTGKIITGNGEIPICELEIELYSGEEYELLQLGEQLMGKYQLIPEERSKFQRGLEQVKQVK